MSDSNHFQNGVARAQQEIANKMCGRVENGRYSPYNLEKTGKKKPANIAGPGWYLMGESSQILRGGPWATEAQAMAEAVKRKRGMSMPVPIQYTYDMLDRFSK